MAKVTSWVGAVLAAGLVFTVPQTEAALTYSTGASSAYTAAPGATVDVSIYLRQTASEINNGNGLFSSGFLVQHTGAADDASVNAAVGNLPVFDSLDAGSSYSDTTAGISQNQDRVTAHAMPTNNLLLLGTLTIQASATAGVVSSYSIGDFDLATTQNLTYNFGELDASIAAGTFSVTSAVAGTPEPATLGLIGVAAGLLGRRVRSRPASA